MASTSIWAVKGWLGRVVIYAENPAKTENDLRHSAASLLLANGFSLKEIQEWLGHANISMTADIYGHLDMTRKRRMAESMSGRFSAPR